jgi:hypothetical protein
LGKRYVFSARRIFTVGWSVLVELGAISPFDVFLKLSLPVLQQKSHILWVYYGVYYD